MTRRLLVAGLTLLAWPAAAHAQTPTTPTEPLPPPLEPKPGGKATFKLRGGMAAEGRRYYAPFQQVVVTGRVRPHLKRELVTLQVVRGERATKRMRRRLRPGGRFSFRFQVGKPGLLRLVVKHPRSPNQKGFRAPPKHIRAVDWNAGSGARGTKVLLLQRRLRRLGFATPVNGYFDAATARAVLAFRKTNQMARTGHASSSVYAMAFRKRGAFKLRHPRAGKHVEFDWSRQVLVLAKGGRPYRVYHTSSGTPATPTVFGTYRFYRQSPGTNALGMVHSSYFIAGYAIHGYASVPNYPASHGCLRVPIPNAWSIFRWIDPGDTIFTYR